MTNVVKLEKRKHFGDYRDELVKRGIVPGDKIARLANGQPAYTRKKTDD